MAQLPRRTHIASQACHAVENTSSDSESRMGVDPSEALCCIASTLNSPLSPEYELYSHQGVLERLRQLGYGDVCANHHSQLVRRAWYHARRVLEITRDMNGSDEIVQASSQIVNAIFLAMEVWTICGTVADFANRTSRWNELAYQGGVTALDKLPRNSPGVEDQSRRLLVARLSSIWSAVMLHQQPPSKRAWFISQPPEASQATWGFVYGGNKLSCLRALFPEHGFTTEDQIVVVNNAPR